jgi:hypothetical protein
MVDELHNRPEGTAKNSFHRYEDKLIENEDFFRVSHIFILFILSQKSTAFL